MHTSYIPIYYSTYIGTYVLHAFVKLVFKSSRKHFQDRLIICQFALLCEELLGLKFNEKDDIDI